MTTSFIDKGFRDQVREEAGHLMWLGAALLVVGVAAVVFPAVSTLVATLFVGWILVLSGLAMLLGAFSIRGAGPFFGALLFALLSIAGGVCILAQPSVGELGITLTLGALFMVQGAFEIGLAFDLRPAPSWGWMLMSALASILMSLVILAGWPGTSMFVLGILIGVNFISSGVAYLFVGGTARRELQA